MSQWQKLLDGMRSNPASDWKIEQIKTICKHLEDVGIVFAPPKRGSHFTVRHKPTGEILTIPAHGRLKPIYVKRFVSMMDSIIGEAKELSASEEAN